MEVGQNFTLGLPELWLLKPDRLIENNSEESRPLPYKGRMRTSERPFVGKRYKCWADGSLAVLADDHGFGLSDRRSDCRQSVEDLRTGPIAHFPQTRAAEPPWNAEIGQFGENPITA